MKGKKALSSEKLLWLKLENTLSLEQHSKRNEGNEKLDPRAYVAFNIAFKRLELGYFW